jgi:hypothetical protein
MTSTYTKELLEGKISTLPEFAAQCARAFFYDAPKLPKDADEAWANSRDFDKEIAHLKKEIEGYTEEVFHENLLKSKKVYEETIERDKRANQNLNEMKTKVELWYPPEMLVPLKEYMLEQIKNSYVETQHNEKHLRFLNTMIDLKSKDPSTYTLQFVKDKKTRLNVIDETVKHANREAELKAETKKWLDHFYAAFPELLVEKTDKTEKSAPKKKENAA